MLKTIVKKSDFYKEYYRHYLNNHNETESVFLVVVYWYLSDAITYRQLWDFMTGDRLHTIEPTVRGGKMALQDNDKNCIIYVQDNKIHRQYTIPFSKKG